MGLFGKSKQADPKEQVVQNCNCWSEENQTVMCDIQVQEWTRKLRKEGNQLERQVAAIRREEAKVTRSLKDAAKKGDKDVCLILAKEVVHARKSVNKLYAAKANINSVSMQMKGQLATIKVMQAESC